MSAPAVAPDDVDRRARRPRLLIVEDEFFAALAMEAALLDEGYEIAGVLATGEAAVDDGAKDCDLVLMDVRLAGAMDGIEAARRLRELGVPCLFTTAYSDAATRSRGEAARPLGWLVKPFSDRELIAAVRAALPPRAPG